LKVLVIFIFLIGCGKQEVEIKDSEHTAKVSLEFSFISEIRQLCVEANPGASSEVIANCTLDSMSIIDTGSIAQLNDTFCGDGGIDAENLTPEDKQQIDELCAVL
jgi:hypothetical protein